MKGERRKQLKRTLSILMVIAMLAAVAVPTMAAGPEALNPDSQSQDSGDQDPESGTQNPTDDIQPPTESEPDGSGAQMVTVRVEGGSGHTYELYQIFIGDPDPVLDGEGKILRYKLANVHWGENAKLPAGANPGDQVPDDILKDQNNEDITDINQIKQYVDVGSEPYRIFGESVEVEPGYYLIKDADGTLGGADEAYTTDVLKVLGAGITIKPKSAKPTVDKQVWDEPEDEDTSNGDEAYPNNAAGEGWGETADHALYERFQFKLIAQLPDEEAIDAYGSYKLVFRDTMSKGVTFDGIESIIVKADQDYVLKDGIKDSVDLLYEVSDNLEKGKAGLDWSLTIPDLKKVTYDGSIRGARVEIVYNAYLNEDAQVNEAYGGAAADTENKNAVYLEYSNNPNAGGEGSMGKSEEDSVWVFTYKMLNKKIAIDDQPNGPYGSSDSYGGMEEKPLGGAGFKLYWAAVDADGKKVPGEEVALVPATAGEDVSADESAGDDESTAAGEAGPQTTALYRPAKDGEEGQEIFSDETTGRFDIIGLDAGSYILRETTTPSGYNTCDDIYIEIIADHCEDDSLAGKADISMYQNGEEISGENKIVNMRGRLLPGTGGIGTTIFYTVGGILAVGAAILLIVRRRMRKAKKSMGKM